MMYFDNTPVPAHFFPNKELYLELDDVLSMDRMAPHVIGMRFESNDDLMALMLLKNALDDEGFTNISLYCPFFPYSTMDHTDGSRPLSLTYVADFINRMQFQAVHVMEPHSSVLPALVRRLEVIDKTLELFTQARFDLPEGSAPVVCFPDLGAEKRYGEAMKGSYQTLLFQKKREFTTGRITGSRCVDDLSILRNGNRPCVILDDLCRGGRTFMSCAEVLRKAGAQHIILCVTHLEPGAFSGVLADNSPVDMVYATDSCLPYRFERPATRKLRLEFVF